MATRDTLHWLINELPESELAAERFPQYLGATADPVWGTLLDAALDDESETPEERQLEQEARGELARGEVRALAAVRGAIGIGTSNGAISSA